MFIQTETTPNPSTLKFLPGCTVLPTGAREFRTRDSAACAPLVEALFDLPGVEAVMLGSDFVSVTKGEVDWAHLKPAALGLIMEHFTSGAPLLVEGEGAPRTKANFSTRPTRRSSRPSRALSNPACAPPSHATAATSPFAVFATASSI